MTTRQQQRQKTAQVLSHQLYEQHPLPGTYLESRLFLCPSTAESHLYHAVTYKDGKILLCDCKGWMSIQYARSQHPENHYDDCTHGQAVLIAIAREEKRRSDHALFNPDYSQDF